ncbi:MAG: transglycosylase domain-containing protein, partial [Pseudomonadota bacterium]
RYTEVASAPTRPGEFSLSEQSLTIFARSYVNHSGGTVAARKEQLPLDSGGVEAKQVWLEPQVVSYIGSADTRASSYLPIAAIPQVIQQAVIAIEDQRFYKHIGVDPISIARATMRNLRAFRLVEGGSTLSQQLAKNLFLSPKKTFTRKLQEVPTALALERHLTKEQLLELYLNEVYLGQEGAVAIHGMPEAASAFFGKKLEDLRVDEAAMLAGIIKAPSYFNPRRASDRALERRNTVLHKMRELGFISENELNIALAKPIKTVARQEHRRLAPFYTAALEGDLSQVIDLDTAAGSGLAVYTGLEMAMQRCAERAVENGLASLEKSQPRLAKDGRRLEAALLAIEPYSGLVKAWVGGRDFTESQFNRVSQANRQIGSTIKPFLYLTALDGSLNSYKVATAASIVEDRPMEIKTKGQRSWSPENFDGEFRGDVTVRYALENSLNMAALYIAERVGIAAVKRTTNNFKIAPDIQALPSLALGALDSNLLRITAAYAALANGGVFVDPRMYISALDGDNVRLSAQKIKESRVADENATYVLTSILQGVLERDTGKGARSKGFDRPAAGKTGTSDNARDAWFIGFTPNLTAGVWVGFDDNSPLNVTGGAIAAPIWGEFMACSAPYLQDLSFVPPRGVNFVAVDGVSGGVASGSCPEGQVVREVFVRGTEPKRGCSLHADGERIEGDDGLPAKGGFWSSLFSN